MAEDEQFSLCWNNFNSNLSAGFHESLCRGDLVDVTLAAEGQFVKAHRLVLSVCSPYFRKMFTQMPANQHAFVFLKDVSHTALKDLIQFMYCGEVNVKQEALPAFISTAEALQIKGLTDSDPPPSQSPAEPSTPTPQQIHQIASPRVRQRTSTTRSYKIETVDDSGDDNKQATQIVIQTTAPPPPQQTTIAQQVQHLQQTQAQTHVTQQQIASTGATTTTTVVTHKRPARSIGSGPHIKRTKSTIDPLDTTDTTAGTQQITVQAAVVTATDSKAQIQQAQEPEYIDLPIELPTKSEPDYTEDTGEVETGEDEATYVEDDSYGDIRYDNSYFTENEDAAGNATAATQATTGTTTGGGASSATTSKTLIKQQPSSFSDTSYVETGDQTNNDAQAAKSKRSSVVASTPKSSSHATGPSTSKAAPTTGDAVKAPGRRGRTKQKTKAEIEKNKLMNKISEAIKKGNGQPAVYASTTKGGMKLIYDGHHFRYTFRKGQYSIFQCCYKESKEECKVRVVSDQKRVYPLDGEHVHFMQATDRSVTSMTFEPAEAMEEVELQQQQEQQQQRQQEQQKLKQTEAYLSNTNDTYDLQLVTITEDGNIVPLDESGRLMIKNDDADAKTAGLNATDEVQEPTPIEPPEESESMSADDFREKIKRRLQKALLGKKK